MPLYEFLCEKCQEEFEELCSGPDKKEKVRCPNCGSEETVPLMSATQVASCSCGSGGGSGFS